MPPSAKWFLTGMMIFDGSDSGDLQWSPDIFTSQLVMLLYNYSSKIPDSLLFLI